MKNKKQSLTPYELKVKELLAEIEKRARELSVLEGQISAAKSDIEAKQRELGGLQVKYDKLLKDSENIEAGNKNSVKANRATEEGSATAVIGMRTEVAATAGRKKTLEKEIALLEGQIEDLKRDKSRLKTDISELESRIRTATAELKKVLKLVEDANRRIREAANKESSVAALVAKNSRQLAEIEQRRGTFEVYVKRMQRIYDKSGIKIDLLKQFDIIRDRK